VSGASWRTVLWWTALAGAIESAIVMGVVEKALIPPVLIIAVLLAVGAVLLRGSGQAGVRIATIALVLFLVSNLVFAGPNLAVPASFGSFAATWVSAITAAVGVISGIASWRRRTARATAARVGIAGIGLAVVAVVIGLVASVGFTNAKPAAGEITLRAKNSKFAPTALAASSGRVSFFLDNADNTLHNFHVLGVKSGTKTMPANHKTGFTVALAPGTYTYRCDFHTDMKGALTVS